MHFICTGKNLPEHMSNQEQRFSMRAVGEHGFVSPESPAMAASFLNVDSAEGGKAPYLFMHGIFSRVEQ